MKENKKWLLYNLTVAYSLYWAGNLLLWFPWSINANFGIALMLIGMPLLWGIGIYNCLIRYKGQNILKGVIVNSIVMLVCAVVSDYVFFGLIREAADDLYKPTTFYGYGILVAMPFIELLLFRKSIITKKSQIKTKDLILIGLSGAICLLALIVIIKYDIRISV
jgi:hypothetical protein